MDDDNKFNNNDADDDLSSILSDEEMAELLEGLGLNEKETEESSEEESEAADKDEALEDIIAALEEEPFENVDKEKELEDIIEDINDAVEEEAFEDIPEEEVSEIIPETEEATAIAPDETFDFIDGLEEFEASPDEFDADNINLDDLDFDFDDPEVNAENTGAESVNLDDLDFSFNEIGEVEGIDNLDFDEEEIEFIKDVSVYDTVERDDPFEQAEAQSEEAEGANEYEAFISGAKSEDEEPAKKALKIKLPSFIHVLAGVVVILILIVGATGLFILGTVSERAAGENELIREVEVVTELARPVANNSSTMFLTELPKFFMMDIVEPIEVIANEMVTEFVFRYSVVWDRYNVTITDSNNREYTLLPDSRREGNFGRRLRFEPLDSGIIGMVLTVEEIPTGITHDFPFRFAERLNPLPVSLLSNRRILEENYYFTMELQNAHFSNTASNVTFSIQRTGEEDLRFDNVHMRVGGRRFPSRELRFHKVDDETTVYNVRFGAVSRVEGELELILAGPHFFFETNMPINTSALMRNTPEAQQIIMLGEHRLTLERMGRMGPIYVVVAHILDADGQRVQGDFDALLTLRDSNGKLYQITGDVRSAQIGADILFDTRRLADFDEIGNLTIQELRLNSVKVRHEELVTGTSLDRVFFRRPVNDVRFIEAAEEYLRAGGVENFELIFHYWLGDEFVAEFEVYEDGEIKTYLLAGTADGREYTFEKIML